MTLQDRDGRDGAGKSGMRLSGDCVPTVVLDSLELWLQEPHDIWRVGLRVLADPPEMRPLAALEVQEWLIGFLPLVHYEINHHEDDSFVSGYSFYPEETTNLAEEIRAGLDDLLTPAPPPATPTPVLPSRWRRRRLAGSASPVLRRLRRGRTSAPRPRGVGRRRPFNVSAPGDRDHDRQNERRHDQQP